MINAFCNCFQSVADAATPWLKGVAALCFLAWLAMLLWEYGAVAEDVAKFKALSPFKKISVVAVLCLFTLLGGTKEGGDRGGASGGLRRSSGDSQQLRTLPPELEATSNLLAITAFEVSHSNCTVSFETAWATNLFDYTDSRNLYLFSSTNLQERKWMPLGQFLMPSGTNSYGFAITSNNVDVTMRPWFLDTFNGIGFYRFGLDVDSDGDGLTDSLEVLYYGSDPDSGDSDEDWISDGEELSLGLNPNCLDTDEDGLSDMEELCVYETNPLVPDSDGDGLPDGWEIDNGLDPLSAEGPDGADGDPYEVGMSNIERYDAPDLAGQVPSPDRSSNEYVPCEATWVTVTGDLAAGIEKTENGYAIIPKGTQSFVGIFLHSREYPNWTHEASQYNDILSWNVSASGCTSLTGMAQVNDEDGSWSLADSNAQNIASWSPVVFKDGGIFAAPSNTDLQVNISLSAMNVSDGALPSSVIVGVFPLEIVQSNWPIGTGFNKVTDSGNTMQKRLAEDEIGYISAMLSRPNINAKFADLPEWITVDWSATLTKERPERPSSDNRTVAPIALSGDDEFDVYTEINDNIGGVILTSFNIAGRFFGLAQYKVRGKNPNDASVRAYIDSTVPVATRGYAWKIAVHESRQGARIYNQFNTGKAAELPNKGAGLGWGIAQIDNHSGSTDLTPFSQVWDWHENIVAMSNKLAYAVGRTNTFIGYYRTAYGNNANWTEPPATNILGYTVSPEMWCVSTIYNGVAGIPAQSAGANSGFHSPIEFKPATGEWVFHANSINPDYVRKIVGIGFIRETRE